MRVINHKRLKNNLKLIFVLLFNNYLVTLFVLNLSQQKRSLKTCEYVPKKMINALLLLHQLMLSSKVCKAFFLLNIASESTVIDDVMILLAY